MQGGIQIKIIQEKYLMMSNLYSVKIILLLSIILSLMGCESRSNQEKKSRIKNFKSSFEQLSKLGSADNIKRVEKTFYKSGKLNQIAYYSDNQLLGYVKKFDSKGRLVRESRYGWTGELKNSLVENIVYDSLKNINYNKSFFLSTIPESVNDTIYFSTREMKNLDFKVKFYDPNLISSSIIIEYDNYIDTLHFLQDEWKTHTFSRLEKGIKNIYFGIEVKKGDSLVSIHESRRVLKISE